MDYIGPLQDHMFLIIVDAFSKWLEIIPVKKATSSAPIDKLRGICSTHGLPDTIVTNNAAVFTSSEMKEFFHTMTSNIQHLLRTTQPVMDLLREQYRLSNLL